ncbi:hypothetical protein SADUNF_Sadunf01G0082100 [Salix dunnii]|uniref:Uncharacterized protein n=1 Tax=Salix dunnii TaxID=1413687 RepID=A0A835TJJ8_9ROSI|nr:hypothetical protein SADUNF_Sadunf01G0082100 [Salix dunnii]
MGKRRGGGGSKKKPPNTLTATNKSFALSTKSGNHNPKSLLKLEHLQNLASWASEEASTPSLAAFFGRQFVSSAEVLGVPLDPSALFQCQSFVPALVEFYVPSVLQEEDSLAPQMLPDIHPIRFSLLQLCFLLQFLTCLQCEIILQPGFNCTIRIEKNRAKARHREKKFYTSTKNNVVYKCHYCSHFNLKRGTPKVHMKEICPPNPKPAAKSKSAKSMLQKSAKSEEGTGSKDEIVKIYETTLPAIPVDSPIMNNPANPFPSIERDEIIKTDDTALPAISVDASIMNSPATPFARVKAYEIVKIDETALPAISVSTCITNSPETPQPSSEFSLLDAKKRKRNRSAKNTDQSESSSAAMNGEKTVSSTSSKRKRKAWTSLKEIVEKRTR